MMRGTKGATLAASIDAKGATLPVDPHWDANYPTPNVGYRAPITWKQMEAFAEAEFEARTSGGWDGPTCTACNIRLAHNGACLCQDGAATTTPEDVAAALLRSVFGA